MGSYFYKTISRDSVIKHFLSLALRLFKNDNDLDYLASLNMAGIVEEILGLEIARREKENAQAEEIRTYNIVRRLLGNEPQTEQEIRNNLLNHAKNKTKHDVADLCIDPKREAEFMLERAIKNYELYYRDTTQEMEDFLNRKQVDDNKLVQMVNKSGS